MTHTICEADCTSGCHADDCEHHDHLPATPAKPEPLEPCWYCGLLRCTAHARATPAEPERELRAALAREARRIIEVGDNRALAADGPVSHVRDELNDSEWRRLYVVLGKIAATAGLDVERLVDGIRDLPRAIGSDEVRASEVIRYLRARLSDTPR